MESYTLAPEGFNKIKRRLIGMFLFIFSLITATYFYFSVSKDAESQSQPPSLAINLIVLVFFLVIMLPMALNTIRQQKRRWLAYRLTFSPTVITKEEGDLPTVTIPVEQIMRLEEVPGDELWIKTKQRNVFIAVPASLNGYEQVKARLAQIREIEQKPRHTIPLRLLLAFPFGVFVVWLMYVVMRSQNASFVLPVGALLALLFGWSLKEMQRSPLLSRSQKLMMWGMLLPVLTLLIKIISVLR